MNIKINNNVAIITDTHFGVKNNSEIWLESQLNYFRNEFIPELKRQGINTIIHAGDLFEDRESTNNNVAYSVMELFEKDLKDFIIYFVPGNHDSYFKNRIDISITKFLDNLENVNRITEMEIINVNGKEILFVPWQPDWEKFTKFVETKPDTCRITIGHFPICGFMLNSKSVSHSGVLSDIFFDNFDMTFSGHFHTRSEQTKNNSTIVYPGSPYHLTRHDIGDERGVCIFDPLNLNYNFINGKETIKYISATYPDILSKEEIDGNVVDIHVKYDETYNEKDFLDYLKVMEVNKPLENFNIKGEHKKLDEYEKEGEDFNDVLELITNYVNNQETIKDPDEVNKIITKLYNKNIKEI